MVGQLLGSRWWFMSRQIGRRGYRYKPHIWAKTDGNHVTWDIFEKPNADIKSVRHDIHKARVHDHFHMDVRIGFKKIGQYVLN